MKKPELIVFAGPNGSGKSTISTPEWRIEPYTNADDIKRALQLTDLEAAQYADRLRTESIQKGEPLCFETVLSTKRKLDFMREAKERGYFIRGYFVLTYDPKINVARVKLRAKGGLHDVPPETVTRRYHAALANIPSFLSICDICHIYDNTDEPFRICRKHKSSLTVYENKYWSEEAVMNLVLGQSPTH